MLSRASRANARFFTSRHSNYRRPLNRIASPYVKVIQVRQ